MGQRVRPVSPGEGLTEPIVQGRTHRGRWGFTLGVWQGDPVSPNTTHQTTASRQKDPTCSHCSFSSLVCIIRGSLWAHKAKEETERQGEAKEGKSSNSVSPPCCLHERVVTWGLSLFYPSLSLCWVGGWWLGLLFSCITLTQWKELIFGPGALQSAALFDFPSHTAVCASEGTSGPQRS